MLQVSYNCTFSINHRGQKIEITETTDLTNGTVFRKTIANRNFEIKMTQGGGVEDLNKNITNIDYSFEGVTFGRLAASGSPDTLYFYNVITGNDGKVRVSVHDGHPFRFDGGRGFRFMAATHFGLNPATYFGS